MNISGKTCVGNRRISQLGVCLQHKSCGKHISFLVVAVSKHICSCAGRPVYVVHPSQKLLAEAFLGTNVNINNETDGDSRQENFLFAISPVLFSSYSQQERTHNQWEVHIFIRHCTIYAFGYYLVTQQRARAVKNARAHCE